MSKKNKGGRPSKKTPDVVQKLERAFEDGSTITEACHTAGIERQTYYNWLDDDDEFFDRMDRAQEYPDAIAKMNIVRSIKREAKEEIEPENSKWWVERKLKREFSKRQELTGEEGKDLSSLVIVKADDKE